MSSDITDLPPPWPHHALAMARKAHSIPLADANLRPTSPQVQEVQTDGPEIGDGNGNSSEPVDLVT